MTLPSASRIYFRDQLREARAKILGDAEAYEAIVQVVERIGRISNPSPRASGLGQYRDDVCRIARSSCLFDDVPNAHPEFHVCFERLYGLVQDARNSAVHEGALARHLTTRALELALVLEDALMPNANTAGDYMVRGPSCAEPWQPLSFIRQTMLASSFSYLPVKFPDREWQLVSDFALAMHLGNGDRKSRMKETLQAAASTGLVLRTAETITADCLAAGLRTTIRERPVLVLRGVNQELIGIVTAFDLL